MSPARRTTPNRQAFHGAAWQLGERLRNELHQLPAWGSEAAVALAGLAQIRHAQTADIAGLGPLPDEVDIEAITDSDQPAKAMAAALEALTRRYPWLATSAPRLTTVLVDATEAGHRAVGDLAAVVARTPVAAANSSGTPHDLLGYLHTALRSPSSQQHLGAFFTPASVTTLMATVALEDVRRGDTPAIIDPCVGTGGMLLAAVEVVRRRSDPASCGWFGIDLDGASVLFAGLNAVAWGLGPHVWLHHGNSLVDQFVGPGGAALRFDVTLGNPPFGGKTRLADLPPGELVPCDPAARRREMGLAA